jgi:hypothetical protein
MDLLIDHMGMDIPINICPNPMALLTNHMDLLLAQWPYWQSPMNLLIINHMNLLIDLVDIFIGPLENLINIFGNIICILRPYGHTWFKKKHYLQLQ